ncbi:MAG: hypothetical protein JSS49_29715 [Planctomycetes bacterium]|nr:hypothetical protein [Planctomycetota bacterium]
MPAKTPVSRRGQRSRTSAGQGAPPVSRPLSVNRATSQPPLTDLVQLAGQIPVELLQQLAAAIQSGQWLFAVWQVSAETIHLDRTATSFPTSDLDRAVSLLAENLQPLKGTP